MQGKQWNQPEIEEIVNITHKTQTKYGLDLKHVIGN